jgi:hypothetical protein
MIRAALLPYCTGSNGGVGAKWAQKLRCQALDVFIQYFPLLGNSAHYSICLPLAAWAGGEKFNFRLVLTLALAFFTTNATKDTLLLPRPKDVTYLEATYLEEYGFPSTHTAAAVVWAWALCETIRRLTTLGPSVISMCGIGYVALIGFSRLYLGVHSLADVCGGLVCGGASLLAVGQLEPIMHSQLVTSYGIIDGSVVCASVLCSSLLLFPDKRDGRTSYRDVLSLVGVATGVVLLTGNRIALGYAVPFSPKNVSLEIGQKFALKFLGLGCVDVVGGLLKKECQKRLGFMGGTFLFIKSAAMGAFIALASDER